MFKKTFSCTTFYQQLVLEKKQIRPSKLEVDVTEAPRKGGFGEVRKAVHPHHGGSLDRALQSILKYRFDSFNMCKRVIVNQVLWPLSRFCRPAQSR